MEARRIVCYTPMNAKEISSGRRKFIPDKICTYKNKWRLPEIFINMWVNTKYILSHLEDLLKDKKKSLIKAT